MHHHQPTVGQPMILGIPLQPESTLERGFPSQLLFNLPTPVHFATFLLPGEANGASPPAPHSPRPRWRPFAAPSVPRFEPSLRLSEARLSGVDSLAVLTLCRQLRLAVPGLRLRPQAACAGGGGALVGVRRLLEE